MTGWLETRVDEIRSKVRPDDEAAIMTLFFTDPAGAPAVASLVEHGMEEMDDEIARRFADVTGRVGATACVVAVIRRDGRPQPVDLRLRRTLRTELDGSGTELLAFVVVGETTWWCAPEDDFDAAA